MEEKKYYELNPSQEVVALQCKYTLFKRVINILTSITFDKEIDVPLMEKAFREVVKRNDCMRLDFKKVKGKIMQSFREEVSFDIPKYEFTTKKEQESFINKQRKKAIKYTKGVVFECSFIKTFDGKFMVFLKVCHLILDLYGINNIYNDLLKVYESLVNKESLPDEPSSFEEIVKKDLIKKNDKTIHERNEKFFTEYLSSKEHPYYAGLHGDNLPLWQKQLKKGSRSMKMFFVHNDTESYKFSIGGDIVSKAVDYCKENNITLPKMLFYVMSVTASKLNGNVKNTIPLELCNCRATVSEKKCAGTKVQSIACYTVVDGEKTFDESLKAFSSEQDVLYRYIGFSDQEFQMLLHKIYKSSLLETFYSITFSFLPVVKTSGVEINVYSNGKCAIPSYIALMWDTVSNGIDIIYDVQTKIISKDAIEKFHKSYVTVLEKVLDNPLDKIKNISL